MGTIMGIYKSYKRHFQLKRCNQTRLEKRKKDLRNDTINEIAKCLDKMDEIQLQTILNSSKIGKENLLEGLKEIKANRKKNPLQETHLPQFGPDIASNLFNNLLC